MMDTPEHPAANRAVSASPLPVSRREQTGWYVYDWANSAFSVTVVTVFLGPYLTTIARNAADASGFIYPLGVPVNAGSYFPYLVSLSVFLQVLVLPVLGAIADSSQRKKLLLGLFAYLGAFATMGMYFLHGENYLLGGALFLVANLSFGASIVFYNAFLPEIATPDQRDRVSARGWALGYLGGGLLLAANLALFSQAERLGLTPGNAVRIGLASAGLWWAVFTLIPLLTLRTRQPEKALPAGARSLTVGFGQLRHTLGSLRRYPQTLLFLAAYLLYNDGIETVIALTSQFGQEELALGVDTLTQAILMVQFIAFFGALFFGRLAAALGTKRTLALSLLVWTGVLVYAYAALATTAQFFALAAVLALVLGGSQALSRSLFSLMIPRGQEAAYFSLYEISDKGTSWIGPLLYGLAVQFTGSFRLAMLSLLVLFVLGIALLTRVDIRRAALEAGNTPPERV